MGKRKTNGEFIKEVYDLVGDEYTFLEEYNGALSNILCRHNICKHEWKIRPNNFLTGYRCPKCATDRVINAKMKSNYEFLEEVFNAVGYEYEFLEEYKGIHTKIVCRHNNCGYEWTVTPNSFLSKKSRCPKCANNFTTKKTNDEFVKEIYNLVGNEYTFLAKYKSSRSKLLCRHEKCGYEWRITPNHFLCLNNRCPQCANKDKTKTNEQFTKEVYDLIGDEYIFLEGYINNQIKIKCKHDRCKTEWDVTPSAFLQGSRCPQCAKNISQGEQLIERVLDSKNIKYYKQHTFNDCRNKHVLQFDFCLPEYSLLIEYDGEQHFEPIDFAGKGEEWAKERFEYTKQNDNIKNQYCKENNIPLLRIPYWDFDNIEDILFKTLSELEVK